MNNNWKILCSLFLNVCCNYRQERGKNCVHVKETTDTDKRPVIPIFQKSYLWIGNIVQIYKPVMSTARMYIWIQLYVSDLNAYLISNNTGPNRPNPNPDVTGNTPQFKDNHNYCIFTSSYVYYLRPLIIFFSLLYHVRYNIRRRCRKRVSPRHWIMLLTNAIIQPLAYTLTHITAKRVICCLYLRL